LCQLGAGYFPAIALYRDNHCGSFPDTTSVSGSFPTIAFLNCFHETLCDPHLERQCVWVANDRLQSCGIHSKRCFNDVAKLRRRNALEFAPDRIMSSGAAAKALVNQSIRVSRPIYSPLSNSEIENPNPSAIDLSV
jgi:hypothetical protein